MKYSTIEDCRIIILRSLGFGKTQGDDLQILLDFLGSIEASLESGPICAREWHDEVEAFLALDLPDEESEKEWNSPPPIEEWEFDSDAWVDDPCYRCNPKEGQCDGCEHQDPPSYYEGVEIIEDNGTSLRMMRSGVEVNLIIGKEDRKNITQGK
jgi:hypothetical protein